MTSDDNSRLVVAVDIGSTHSSYAFSYHHDFVNDPLKIRTTAWGGHRNLFTPKAPTAVLLSRTLELVTFGYEAEDTYAEMLLYEEQDGSRLFTDIVKQLVAYTNFMNNWRNCRIKDTEGRTAPVLKVFSSVFTYFRQHLNTTLASNGVDLLGNVVTWVVTMAPSWNSSTRECITMAAVESGIPKESLVLALGPEAALCHKYIMAPNDEMFRKGARTMVLDLGGGITDFAVYEVTDTRTLTELYHTHSSDELASDVVNSNFVTLLNDIAGGCFKDSFRQMFLADYYDMLREFEAKKRLVGQEETAKFTFAVPISLENLVLSKTTKSFKATIESSEFAEDVAYLKSKIRIDAVVISALFEELLDYIQNKIREICILQKVSRILLVGGFSECPLVGAAIREKFPNYNVVTCPDAGMAVLKGTVLYGHNDKQLHFITPPTKDPAPVITELLNEPETNLHVNATSTNSIDQNTRSASVSKSPVKTPPKVYISPKRNTGHTGSLMEYDGRPPREPTHKKSSRACVIL